MTGTSLSMIVDGSSVIFTGSYFYKIRREWRNATVINLREMPSREEVNFRDAEERSD
jgi:hypothetical protein